MIEHEDIERLKEIFITRQECNTQMDDVSKKLGNDNARLLVIEKQLEGITKLLYAIGTGIIMLIVGGIGNPIIK